MIFAMEPNLTTAPELAGILAALAAREPIFHHPEFGTSRESLEPMMADDFWETGASGRRYSREFVLDELMRRSKTPHEDVWETSDFFCRRLAADMYLLTYTPLQQGSRLTRRASIWQKTDDDWKVVYHQGTIVQDARLDA
jgi:hypothetical protein